MADRYQQLVNTPIGRIVSKQVGLPAPVKLERYEPGQPVIDGSGAARRGARRVVWSAAIATRPALDRGGGSHRRWTSEVRSAAADAGLDAKVFNPEAAPADGDVQGAGVRRQRDRLQRAARAGLGVLSPDASAGCAAAVG